MELRFAISSEVDVDIRSLWKATSETVFINGLPGPWDDTCFLIDLLGLLSGDIMLFE